MQTYFIYVIESKTGLRYIGQTENLEKRIDQHNSKLSTWTKRDTEWKIIYTEEYSSRKEVIIRERYLKSGQGRQWLKEKLLRSP